MHTYFNKGRYSITPPQNLLLNTTTLSLAHKTVSHQFEQSSTGHFFWYYQLGSFMPLQSSGGPAGAGYYMLYDLILWIRHSVSGTGYGLGSLFPACYLGSRVPEATRERSRPSVQIVSKQPLDHLCWCPIIQNKSYGKTQSQCERGFNENPERGRHGSLGSLL